MKNIYTVRFLNTEVLSDFRSTTDVNVGDVFDVVFSIVDKLIGIQKVEVIGIRKDEPINHLENLEHR